jgi:transposase
MSSYFLGGDASKGYCNFTLLDHNKRIVEEDFQLDDSYEGHQSLCNFFRQFFSSHQEGDIRAGFESTGGYENNWYQLLWKLQDGFKIKVARLNPYGVKYHKKASLDRIETDKISARKIADYLITYPDKVEYSKEDFFAELRRHWKYIRMLKKQKAQLQTHLKAQLYVSQPQLLVYCKEGMPDWIFLLLKKYPTAMDLAKAAVYKLSIIPYISKERAKELIGEAKRSVASMKSPIIGNMIKSAAREILNMQETIKEQVKLMISTYDMPEIELLKSFPGINDYSALGLLLEIGAIERYPSVKNLVSFFGIHPVYRQSGDGKWGNHMSKKGRKEPRWILFNVAKSAICCNEMIQELYNDYLKKGHCKMSALGIIMHKILRIVYGMLKHKQRYDPNVDRANRKKVIKTKQEQESKKVDKSRRYQPYDKNAPVSKRQAKKRELTDTEVVEVVTQNGTSSQVTRHPKDNRREK